MAREILQFDNLADYLLVKNGNTLYKVPFRDGFAVLKVYYGSRSLLRYVGGSISNYFEGQTSFMPRARMANEKKCLQTWRQAGFRVFETYEDVVVRGLPPGGYLLFEYLPGLQLKDYFGNPALPLQQRLATYRCFLADWHRRHRLAVTQRQPLLVHENGDMKHVMLVGEGFLYFDFEMLYRCPRRIEEYVAREILAYLKSLGKAVGPELFPVFLAQTIAHYPSPALLRAAHRVMFAHPNPVIRRARALERRFSPRAAKPFSKYNVARRLKNLLDGPRGAAG